MLVGKRDKKWIWLVVLIKFLHEMKPKVVILIVVR